MVPTKYIIQVHHLTMGHIRKETVAEEPVHGDKVDNRLDYMVLVLMQGFLGH